MNLARLAAAISFVLLAGACAPNTDTDAGEPGGEEIAAPNGGVDSTPLPEGETGAMCGGIAGFQCASDADYCEMAPGQCVEIADAAGVCKPKPEICTQDYAPVCGCDGETYSNACAAASNGVSVASEGACSDEAG